MLDAALTEQLKTVFTQLDQKITLLYDECAHADQAELMQMLEAVAATSPNIELRKNPGVQATTPRFVLEASGKFTGICFRGIPGGHEFTSLILAILNASGKGKFPDELLQRRIRRLKGPIELKSYISLTCENCPEVVQTLNQIALLHGNFRHEIIDGQYAQDEISKYAIQGVPSLVANEKMIHSGRIHLLDLLQLLESTFGQLESSNDQISKDAIPELDLGHYDVAVIGGGPAGASAAIYSVRKGLKTILLTEKIGGQVQETKGIENLISVPFTEGPKLAAQLYEHVASYPVQILENRRVAKVQEAVQEKVQETAKGEKAPKLILLESGEKLQADAIIVTTGAKWRELGVPGEKEYLGRGVAYCPHCDGPYYKNKVVAVIGGGNSGVEAAIDLAGIVKEVVLFEYQEQLKADKILIDKMKTLANVSIISNAKTEKVLGDGQKVTGLLYTDRATQEKIEKPLDGVFVQIGLVPNSQFLKGTVEMSAHGEIIVDGKGRTSTKGIYAAGDVTTTPYKQIIIAMGEGAKAALGAFEDRMFQA